jgi:hypothetical protein
MLAHSKRHTAKRFSSLSGHYGFAVASDLIAYRAPEGLDRPLRLPDTDQ